MPPLNTLERTSLAVVISQLMMSPMLAATLTVDSDRDDNGAGCTLREAIFSVNWAAEQGGCVNSGSAFGTSDTIDFSLVGSHTITLTAGSGGQLAIADGKNVTINGTGETNLIISGGGTNRVLKLGNTTVNLNDLTLSGGSADFGGGIYARYTTLGLTNTTVSGNSASQSGGGIHAWNTCNLTLTGSTVSGNSAGNNGGGGIRTSVGCSVDLVNSTVSGNSTSLIGGGINASGGGTSVSLANSTVSANTSGAQGGGVAAWSSANIELNDSTVSANTGTNGGGVCSFNSGTMSLTNSTVDTNSATFSGGGVFTNYYGTVSLTNSTVSNNSASNRGGGISAGKQGSVVLSNSTLSKNTATNAGGGVSAGNLGSATLSNSTISGNSATTYGGGIHTFAQGYAKLGHSIVSGNSAGIGAEISGQKHSSVYSVTSFNKSLLGDSRHTNAQAFNSFVPAPWDMSATIDGTHTSAPQSILSPLADNGGPTETHALVLGSPALDIIDSTDCGPLLSTIKDQRGQQRDDGFCDIGSFELKTSTITINTRFDTSGGGQCSLRDAILSSNSNSVVGACAAGAEAEHLVFDPATFSDSSANLITLSAPLPAITSDLTITGPNQFGLRIDANNTGRVLSLDGATVMLDKLTISGGSVSNRGGGIYAYNGSRMHLNSSTISGNTATNEGGGIFAHSSYARMINSTVSGNIATHGGGIYASNSSDIGLVNSTLSTNSASGNGGGIAANASSILMGNSIVVGNDATSGAEILNNASGFAGSGTNLFGDDGHSFAEAFTSFVPGASDYVATSDTGGPQGIHTPSALSSILDQLDDNGGPSHTHALVFLSPAIDKGSRDICLNNGITLDQRGEERDIKCDIGAYEFIDDSMIFVLPLKNGKTAIFSL